MTQPGSGSSPTRISRPVRSRRAWRWSARRSSLLGGQDLPVAEPRVPPPEGQRRDAAPGGVVGQQPGEHLGEVGRVGEPGRLGPVGVVDAVLDDLVLEAAVGETVEGDDLEAALVEGRAQPVRLARVVGEPPGDGGAEPQAEPEEVGAEVVSHGQGEAVEPAR